MSRSVKLRSFWMMIAMSGGRAVAMCGHRHRSARAARGCFNVVMDKALDLDVRSCFALVHQVTPSLRGDQ